MKWFPEIRLLAMLRRIAKAIERSNELTQERMKFDYPQWRERPKPRKAEISVPTVEQWNKNYRRES
jgi:hypothetical protein